MRITQRTRKKPMLLIVVGVILILTACVGIFLAWRSKTTTGGNPEIQPSKTTPDPRSEQPIAPEYKDDGPVNKNPPVIAPTYGISIASVDATNDGVKITAVVDSPQNGSCRYVLNHGSYTIEHTATSTGSDGPKTCKYTFSRSEFPTSGPWSLEASFMLNGTSASTHATVTIP